MKKRGLIVLVPLFLLLIITVCTIFITLPKETNTEKVPQVLTFADYTEYEICQNIPLFEERMTCTTGMRKSAEAAIILSM